jgi:hypothetical protein
VYVQQLNFPEFEFRFRTEGQNKQIFDSLRRKYVALTPEEWVRQHVIRYLVEEKKYPAALMGVEKGIRVMQLARRVDVVVYARDGRPWMIVECKSAGVPVTEDTLYQAARYNMALGASYFVLTNGLEHYCCRIGEETISFLDDLPVFGE